MISIKTFIAFVMLYVIAISNAFAQQQETDIRDSAANYYMLKNADLYYSMGKKPMAKSMYLGEIGLLNNDQKLNLIDILAMSPKNMDEKKMIVQLLNSLPSKYDNVAMPYWGRVYRYGYKGGLKDTTKGRQLIEESVKNENPTGYFFNAWLLIEAKKDKDAFEYFKKAAAMDHSMAINNLGWFYKDGRGVSKNYDSAFYWFSRAANLGNGLAYANIGWLYYYGQGVPKNYDKAMENFSLALQYGDDSYSYVLGLGKCYLDGSGIKQDVDSAIKYYRLAANMGNAIGFTTIGYIYEYHKNNDKQFTDSALLYYAVGAIKGDVHAYNDAGKALFDGVIVKQDYVKALDLFKKGMELGDIDSKISYASMLYEGQGTKKDATKAMGLLKEASDNGNSNANLFIGLILIKQHENEDGLKYLKKSASDGNSMATLNIGLAYWSGREIKQDVQLGFQWIETSANMGNAAAEAFLGNIYLVGYFNFQKDSSKAFYWLQKAAVQGDSGGLNDFGECYYTGFGVKQDFEKARYYYQLSADKNEPIGKFSLGVLYLNGEGVIKDLSKARKLFDEACKGGITEGCEKLKDIK